MKKNIAIALLATGSVAGPALAQSTSSVTLYGIIDLSVRAQSGLSGANAPAAGSMGSVNSGVGPTSRWGIRGSEDLGGGLRAIFNLESTLGE
jgi:predicted porin